MPHRLSAGRLAVAAVVLTGSAASGAVTIFDDRGAFEAVAGADLVRESFEADPIGLLSLPYAAASSGLIVDLDPTGSYDAYITNGQIFSLPSDGVNHLSFIFGQGTYRQRSGFRPMRSPSASIFRAIRISTDPTRWRCCCSPAASSSSSS